MSSRYAMTERMQIQLNRIRTKVTIYGSENLICLYKIFRDGINNPNGYKPDKYTALNMFEEFVDNYTGIQSNESITG